MGNIDWLPIADVPEHLKDGRNVLLWVEDANATFIKIATGRGAVCGHFVSDRWWVVEDHGPGWVDAVEGRPLTKVTHVAEINPPE